MPAIFSGLKVSITLAVVGAVVGEFVGSNSGIGYVLQRSIGTFDLPTMFAALVILALLGVVLFWIVDRIESLVIPWHVSQREDIIFASVREYGVIARAKNPSAASEEWIASFARNDEAKGG